MRTKQALAIIMSTAMLFACSKDSGSNNNNSGDCGTHGGHQL